MKFARTIMVAAIVAGGAPTSLFACAACYGQSDSPLATGMNYGVFTLLGVVLSVLTVFVVGFVHIVRKSERLHQEAVKRMEEL